MANIVINGELLGDGHLMETDHEAIRLGDHLRLSAPASSLGCVFFFFGKTVTLSMEKIRFEKGTSKELQHIFEAVTHLQVGTEDVLLLLLKHFWSGSFAGKNLPGNYQCNLAQSMGGALSTSCVRVVYPTGNPRRLPHYAVERRTVQPPYRLQKVRAGGQQGELLSIGNRLYGGPSSRSQRQLAAAVGVDSRASSASASAIRDRRHASQRLLSQHLLMCRLSQPPEEPSNELHQLRLQPADPLVVFQLIAYFSGCGVIVRVALELVPGELEVLRTMRPDVPAVEGGRQQAHQQEELKVAFQPVEVGSKRGEQLVQLAVFRRPKQNLAIRFVDRHQAGEGVEGFGELSPEESLKVVRQHAPVGEDGPLRRTKAIGGPVVVVGVGARWAIGPKEGVHADHFDSSNSSTAITTSSGLLHPEEGTSKELQHIFEAVTHL
ncbi:hypothetical protein TYRP_002951 [Tyrophagus putrescentiae]|nr:hypothetical protein TYRP_002951 [Tyrophagus putrescentiae]